MQPTGWVVAVALIWVRGAHLVTVGGGKSSKGGRLDPTWPRSYNG